MNYREVQDLPGFKRALTGTASLGAEGFNQPSGKTQSSLDTLIRQNNTLLFLAGVSDDRIQGIEEELVEIRKAISKRETPDLSGVVGQLQQLTIKGKAPEPRGVLRVYQDPYLQTRRQINEETRGRSSHRSRSSRGGSEPPRRTPDPPRGSDS
ncbi:hypothetical protein [Sweet potato pakakuy virus]|uniref:Uncharacterized protein n=1 Tax=Sweet potato pakakuy virus TaxID=2034762 RepID=C4NFM3_9VIRU|nr:hypothetical protein [Sweet potato pakakuy virus]ACN56744.1 hypothetical protein [Sweet potato pakakuy virus]